MFVICPRCKERLDADGDVRGQEVQCPSCNLTFTVPKVTRLSRAPEPPKPKRNANFFEFLLGIFLGPLGILISILFAGASGAKAAFRGFMAQLLIGVIIYFTIGQIRL